jgi:hypothetical protein
MVEVAALAMRLSVEFDEADYALEYLRRCARIRDISVSSLIHRLMETIAEDELVLSILDDADCIKERRKGEHHYSGA